MHSLVRCRNESGNLYSNDHGYGRNDHEDRDSNDHGGVADNWLSTLHGYANSHLAKFRFAKPASGKSDAMRMGREVSSIAASLLTRLNPRIVTTPVPANRKSGRRFVTLP